MHFFRKTRTNSSSCSLSVFPEMSPPRCFRSSTSWESISTLERQLAGAYFSKTAKFVVELWHGTVEKGCCRLYQMHAFSQAVSSTLNSSNRHGYYFFFFVTTIILLLLFIIITNYSVLY